jgi:aminoglycoside 6'-N-acetyltransferase I
MPYIRIAQQGDLDPLVAMRLLLWPEISHEEESQQTQTLLSTGMSGTLPAAILVAQDGDGSLIGFLEVGLRSHADGCDTAHAVGFVEGWFVDAAHRGRGIGRALMRAGEEWSRAQGCAEMASDALIDNQPSQRAHQSLGFEVVDRCVHFRKAL